MKAFRHDGKEYEIRVYETTLCWKAAVFHAGTRVSRYIPLHEHGRREGMKEHLNAIESEFKDGRLRELKLFAKRPSIR